MGKNDRPPFHVVSRRGAGCIRLTRDAKGRRTLTLPLGAPDTAAGRFLLGWDRGAAHSAAGTQTSEEKLTQLAAQWAERMGVECPKIVFQKDSSRWGNCLWTEGTIVLHPALLGLPGPVLEESLVHELEHFRIHDHSPAFWTELTAWLPDWAYCEGFLRGWASGVRRENRQR